MNVMFKKMIAKQGIKNFKYQAVDAIVNYYKQLHDINEFDIVCPENLRPIQKRYALRAITLIKEKCSGKIKGRACVDGRSQRSYIKK